MAIGFAVLVVVCLVGALALAVHRNERMTPELKSAQRGVLLSAVLNLIPGLGLWLMAKRPKAALMNLLIVAVVVAFVLWSGPRHFKFLPRDGFSWIFWLEALSVAWGYNAAMSKTGLSEEQVLKPGPIE